MHIMRRHGWELPERMVTPEALVMDRRRPCWRGAGVGSALAAGLRCAAGAGRRRRRRIPNTDPGRAITPEKYATTYNNYYEFSDSKNLWREAQALKQRPWTISLERQVKQPRTLGIDDLLKQVQIEERVYRHRCVEAWAMTVPWTGFPLSELLKIAEPLGSAKYVVFETAAGQDDARPALAVLSLALHRGVGDRRGGERPGIHFHGHVRQAAAAAERRTDPTDNTLEIRLQVGQGAGKDQLHRQAAGQFLAGDPVVANTASGRT